MAQEPKTAHQLTMLYNGKVLVLDNFPAEKLEELISFGQTLTQPSTIPNMIPPQPPSTVIVAEPSTIAQNRLASIRRFLEKRKDRVAANPPQ